MTETTTDLAAWLLEQIAEDERVAGDLAADGYPKHGGRVLSVEGTLPLPWPDRWNPALVLRECEAKRRIIEKHQLNPIAADRCGSCGACPDCAWDVDLDDPDWPCVTLKLLAVPYADRPGYREEWRP